jgi:hypothetical protein
VKKHTLPSRKRNQIHPPITLYLQKYDLQVLLDALYAHDPIDVYDDNELQTIIGLIRLFEPLVKKHNTFVQVYVKKVETRNLHRTEKTPQKLRRS